MNDSNHPKQRLGGHLTLILVLLILLAGWRIGLAGGGEAAQNADEAAAAVDVVTTAPPADAFSPDVVAELAEAAVDYTRGELPIIGDSSLSPALNPFTYQGKLPEHSFRTYVVERGDTPNLIAERFGIQTETLLGGNPRLSQESSLLQTGVELIILPIDGVLHDVEPGDTLESIAAKYSIPIEDIIGYGPNNLEFPYRLYPKTQVMVPGAVREVFIWTPPDLSNVAGATSSQGAGVRPVIVGTGTFIFPVNSRNFTQHYWYGHRAIDIGLAEGTAVFASDTGTVTFAGYDTWGYGYLIVINHGNGHETFYAHLSAINVAPGQIVYQGNLIGATGNTGRSSGPHIHFEIRLNGNPDQPCWYLDC